VALADVVALAEPAACLVGYLVEVLVGETKTLYKDSCEEVVRLILLVSTDHLPGIISYFPLPIW